MRWCHRFLFRVGAGSRRIFLDGAAGQRSPARHHGSQLPGSSRAFEEAQGEHANGGLHARDQSRCNSPSTARHIRLMRLTLAVVGKPRNAALAAAIHEYETRAARYWPLDVHEVKEERAARDPRLVQQREGERLLQCAGNSHIVACDSSGKSFTSEKFAQWLKTERDHRSDIAFVIAELTDSRTKCSQSRARKCRSRRGPCRTSSRAWFSRSSSIARGQSFAASRTTNENGRNRVVRIVFGEDYVALYPHRDEAEAEKVVGLVATMCGIGRLDSSSTSRAVPGVTPVTSVSDGGPPASISQKSYSDSQKKMARRQSSFAPIFARFRIANQALISW